MCERLLPVAVSLAAQTRVTTHRRHVWGRERRTVRRHRRGSGGATRGSAVAEAATEATMEGCGVLFRFMGLPGERCQGVNVEV